jgi:DNA modification methylase
MTPFYQDEFATIFHGDCREVLPTLGAVDLVLTDPPYGIDLDAHAKQSCMDGTTRRRIRPWAIANDGDLSAAESVAEWADGLTLPLCMFASPYRPLPGRWSNILVWDKGPAVGGGGDPETCWKRTFELIYVRRNRPLLGKRDQSVLRFHVNTGSDFEFHQAQKPVPLMAYLIGQLVPVNGIILDPFMGSGTTLRAAKDLGRKAIGVEVEERYCEIAAKRMEQGVFQWEERS